MTKWKSVSLRQELIAATEKTIKTGRYRSISEFVAEAIRLRLEELSRSGGISKETYEKHTGTPQQLLYTTKHMWVQIAQNGNIRVGISEFVQKRLEDIAYIYIDPLARKKDVKKMERFGVAETWLYMFDLYAPVSGKIIKFNENLRNNPHLINEDPYDKGWIIEIQPKNPQSLEQELEELLSSRQYSNWVSKFGNRISLK
jgi:glycine cleavage system H protein